MKPIRPDVEERAMTTTILDQMEQARAAMSAQLRALNSHSPSPLPAASASGDGDRYDDLLEACVRGHVANAAASLAAIAEAERGQRIPPKIPDKPMSGTDDVADAEIVAERRK